MEDINLLSQLIGNVGFPSLVAWYVLTRINKNLERLNETMDKLERRIERLEDKILKEESK